LLKIKKYAKVYIVERNTSTQKSVEIVHF